MIAHLHLPQKTTVWFDLEGDPAWPGVYERDITCLNSSVALYGYWDGMTWYQCAHSPDRALDLYNAGYESMYTITNSFQRWRGLAQQP